MFTNYNLIITDVTVQSDGTGASCYNGLICANGILDYKCQIKNQCYINLLELGLYIIAVIVKLVYTLDRRSNIF